MENKKIIYTIGYTLFQKPMGFDIDLMYNILQRFHVSYIVDVRSIPYSKQYPQCNAETLKILGKRYSVPYIHMPEIGAKANPSQNVFTKASDIFYDDIFPISKTNRPDKSALSSDEEIVDFRKFRKDEHFLDGIKRIEAACDKNFTLALMCSEKHPMDCHRYFLISKTIEQKFSDWIGVEHIIQDNNGEITTISNEELDNELAETIMNKSEIKKLDILNSSIFCPAKLDNYYGETQQDKLKDFCDRYWNLMHGWKKIGNTNNDTEDYD